MEDGTGIKDRLTDLMQRIYSCPNRECKYRRDWMTFQRIHYLRPILPPQWLFWGKNKYPYYKKGEGTYYTLYEYDCSSNIVFVALRPSTGFISNADFLFAHSLLSLGLMKEVYALKEDTFVFYKGPLVTDIIKCRGKAGTKVTYVPERCMSFLKEELEIVRQASKKEPKVVAVGDEAYKILRKYREEFGIRWLSNVWHYTYAQRMGISLEEYIEKLREVLKQNDSNSTVNPPLDVT